MCAHGHNFAKTMLRLARDKDSLSVVNDQWGAPTSAALIADVTAHLILQMSREGDRFPFGLYHLSASGQTQWHEYACRVLESAAAAGWPLRTHASEVQAISTREYRTAARRPKNSLLDTSLLRSTFGMNLPDWQHGLDHILQELLSKP
jgi:dTDP-4-dehydrorhamnose reductase